MPTTQVMENYITWALQAVADQLSAYERYEDYYQGDHSLEFSTAKWNQHFGSVFKNFEDNWCQIVVDAVVERMEITGFTTEDATGEFSGGKSSDAKLAEDIFDRNELHLWNVDLMSQALIKGDSFLIGWKSLEDKDRVDIFYNDATETQVYYDPANPRRVIRAAKKYIDEKAQPHLILYFPDFIHKLLMPNNETADTVAAKMAAGIIEPMEQLPSGWFREEAPIKNILERVPVYHFKNRSPGSTHGLSELKNVIPIQNAVNKLLMDLMLGSEFGSFRQKWAVTGTEPKDGYGVGGDRMFVSTDPNGKFGNFDQTDLEPIFKSVEVLVAHIAKITQTPMHYLRTSGDMPSGEALKTAESGLVKKCLARQKLWGAQWSRVMDDAVFLETSKHPKSPIFPIWKDPETRHDLEQAQTAQLMSILGIPLEVLWAKYFDFTQEEIRGFKEANLAIVAQVMAQVVAQSGQLPPGSEQVTAQPQDLVTLLSSLKSGGSDLGGMNISQVLALLPKGATSKTTAGEATTKPQPNTRPPASPTRRSTGFKD